MITIKFPKSPRTAPRRKIQSIGQKYDYSEDDYYSIINIPNINDDLYQIFNIMGYWNNSCCLIDDEEIETNYLKNLLDCISNKVPETNLKWYHLGKYVFRDEDLIEIKEDLKILINGDFIGNPKFKLDRLLEIKLISVVSYNKEYKIEKEEFKEKINNIINLITKIYPKFSGVDALDIINSFPDKIIIKEPKTSEEIENEGEEWVDWYNPMKWKKDMLDTLKKIEENTRK